MSTATEILRTGATFSPCRTWRYTLWRVWEPSLPTFVVIGLNPSTADEVRNDPTVRRCMGFALREGCGRLVMMNMFGYRATYPRDMLSAPDPVGPGNIAALRKVVRQKPHYIVAAWGTHGSDEQAARIGDVCGELWCFGVTRSGAPKHPLYLRATTPLVPWNEYTPAGGNG
jgi:hypothetical protein